MVIYTQIKEIPQGVSERSNKVDYIQEKQILEQLKTANNYLASIETILADILLHLKGEPNEESDI